ncbi:MAG: hypothetical protein J5617_03900 [Bacilli bacterium]|nr:hypothetical protein [Bacilli bacterium]
MSTTELVCLIGIMLVCFILGRKSKPNKFPIAGDFNFEKNEPVIEFKMNFKDICKFNYVVFRIRGRINDINEGREE